MDNIFLIIAYGIVTLTVERNMRVFFERRRTPFMITTLSYLLLFVTLLLQSWVLENAVVAILLYLFVSVIVTSNYESDAMKRLAAVAGVHYIMLSLTIINNVFALYLPTSWYIGNEFLTVLIISLFIYVVSAMIFPLFKHIRKSVVNLNKLWLPLIIWPVPVTFLGLFSGANSAVVSAIGNTYILLGMLLMLFFFYNTLSKVVEDTLNSALYSQEREYYFTQCQLMQESMEKVKSVRHDIKNHLTVLKEYTADNKTAADYLNSLLGDVGESEIYSNTGNIAFDSIINFKLKNAKEDNIKLDIRVAVPPVINIDVSDIVTVLGNLLDNALDAVSKVNDKIIKLDVEFGKSSLFIKVDNSFNGKIKYLDTKPGAEVQVATLKSGGGHGYGLRNIQKSVEKYNGYLKISYTDNVFTTGALLYVSDN